MITTYRYGEAREGFSLRLGVTRQLPRGVRKEDYQKKGYFDLWMRILSPSPELLSRYRKKHITFREFAIGYRSEMECVEPRQIIDLLALLSRTQEISLGCYCQREDCCHRSILRQLVAAADLALPGHLAEARRPGSSPVCYVESLS